MSQLPKDMINYRGRISGVGISGSNYDNNCSGLRALSLCIAVALHRPDVVRLNNLRLTQYLALVAGNSFSNLIATIITLQYIRKT